VTSEPTAVRVARDWLSRHRACGTCDPRTIEHLIESLRHEEGRELWRLMDDGRIEQALRADADTALANKTRAFNELLFEHNEAGRQIGQYRDVLAAEKQLVARLREAINGWRITAHGASRHDGAAADCLRLPCAIYGAALADTAADVDAAP